MSHMSILLLTACLSTSILFFSLTFSSFAQKPATSTEFDGRVKRFLSENRPNWHDRNIPYEDGEVLYSLIVKNDYKRVLEIGTFTGHSAIWIAWALSKTGGRLITIEIDEGRYKVALGNFKKAGVEGFIDARLGDAHQLVRKLKGPFDFVFSDADKEWYTQYFKEVDPKLVKGGCFTAHNVTDAFEGIDEFLNYIRSLPNYQTAIDHSSSSGISISSKQSN